MGGKKNVITQGTPSHQGLASSAFLSMNFWHLGKVRSEGRSLPPLSMRSWNFRSAAKSSSLSSSCAETLLSQCFEGTTPHEKKVFYCLSKQKNHMDIYNRTPDVCFKSAHLPDTIGLLDHEKTNKSQVFSRSSSSSAFCSSPSASTSHWAN